MPRMKVAPTRSSLLRIRQSLALARRGHDILDRKREVLTTELIGLAQDAQALQEEVWEALDTAYHALEVARLTMGRERVEWAALAVTESVEVKIVPHSIMGVVVPKVEPSGEPPEMSYSPGDTTVALDEAAEKFRNVLSQIPAISESMTTAWRLAGELKRTVRRVNALEYIFIPQYEETEAFIESSLEEREREDIFRMKRVKSRASPATIGPPTRDYAQPYRDISAGGTGGRAFRAAPSTRDYTQPYRDISGGRGSGRE